MECVECPCGPAVTPRGPRLGIMLGARLYYAFVGQVLADVHMLGWPYLSHAPPRRQGAGRGGGERLLRPPFAPYARKCVDATTRKHGPDEARLPLTKPPFH